MERITKQHCLRLPEDIHVGMEDLNDRLPAEVLNELELEEYRTFNNSGRKREFISARQLVRTLAEEIGYDPGRIVIKKDELGKPFVFHKGKKINLSLAHADRKVICGLCSSIQIGIDLEPADRKVDERLRERVLNREEQKILSGEKMIRIWTLKEAMVKLEGRGMRTSLDQTHLFPENDNEFRGSFSNGKQATVLSFMHAGYWLAIAYYRSGS